MNQHTTLLATLVCLAAIGCGRATANHAEVTLDTPPPTGIDATVRDVRVEVAEVQPSSARLQLALPGEVMGSRDARLAAALGGYVEAVLVHRGDNVRRGQAIARINTSAFVAQRDQARAQAELAQAELERARALGDLGSDAALDRAETQATVARAAADLAEIQLGRSVITAPYAGVIGQISLEVGEVVAPGAPVARLVQLDPAHVTVSVSDRDVINLTNGMPVTVTADADVQPLPGTIVAIDTAADLQTRTFIVEVEVANALHRLRPGMIATVALAATVGEGALIVPQDWLVTSLDGIGVFVEQDGVARWRPVTTGAVVHDQVVVALGLSAGERVVTTGHRDLVDGDALLLSRVGTCCTAGRVVF